MRTIYKYEIRPDKLIIEIPKGAKILTVREQFNSICVWAEVNTEHPIELRHFEIFGTGHVIPEGMGQSREYIGTAVLEYGALIFHVYEYTGT